MDLKIVSVIIGIAGLAISIIFTAIPKIYTYIKEKGSPYTGIWEDEIFSNKNDEPVKKDIFYLKQKGHLITGTGKRYYPIDQNDRRYKIQGILLGHDFVALFWATNKKAMCYGCWFITQINGSTFDGFYLRIEKNGKKYPNKRRARLIRSEKSIKDFKRI